MKSRVKPRDIVLICLTGSSTDMKGYHTPLLEMLALVAGEFLKGF